MELTKEQHDTLLHLLLTHPDVETLLRACARRGRKDAEPCVFLTGRDHLSGKRLLRRLGAQEFLTLTLSLVENAGRGDELREELAFLSKVIGGMKV